MDREQTANVLLLDDYPDYRDAVADGLMRLNAGLKVETYGTVEEAQNRMARGGIDLCLIDINLPNNQSGIEVAHKFRQVYPAVRLILVSMYDHLLIDDYPFADDIMHKSIGIKKLEQAIHFNLNGKERLEREMCKKWPRLERYFREKRTVGLASHYLDEDTFGRSEKIQALTRQDLLRFCVNAYNLNIYGPDQMALTMTPSAGCDQNCFYCHCRKKRMKRPYTGQELWGQLLMLLRAQMVAAYFRRTGSLPRLSLNFSGEGDLLVNNAAVGSRFLLDVDRVFGGQMDLVVTSVGDQAGLDYLRRTCAHLPIVLYWSIHSFCEATRKKLQPIAARTPLLKMREYFYGFYREQCRVQGRNMPRITLAVMLLPGVNDRARDIALIGDFVRGYPFKVKVMPYSGDQLLHYSYIGEKMENFARALNARGVDCRIRWSTGLKTNAGCGVMASPIVSSRDLARAKDLRRKLNSEK